MNITDKFYYKSDIMNLLELDENIKYSLLYVFFKFKDLISDNHYKEVFEIYKAVNLDNDNQLIDFIFKNFTLRYKFIKIDKGNIVKNITI
jgi:hypothetical protein